MPDLPACAYLSLLTSVFIRGLLYTQEFLQQVAQWFELTVFTASQVRNAVATFCVVFWFF
jgi:hypothetical protein